MKGLKGLFLGILTVIFLFSAAPLAAQNVKVGVVDLQKFQKNSKAFQRASLVVKKKFDDMQQKLNDERSSLSKLDDELKKQSMMLSLDAQEDKKRELEKKQRQFKFMYDEYSQEMKDTEMEAIKKVMKELEKVVEEMGKKEGYTIILERRTLGLLYFNNAVDLTDRVTEAYDKQNP
jgi:outer membrane protein